MYTLPKKDRNDVRIAFIKINDLQHIELFNEQPPMPHNMLSHICFTVDKIEKTRAFLRSKGYDLKPSTGSKTKLGDYAFEIKDPNGLLIEFVQRLPTGKEMQDSGKFMPETRISPHEMNGRTAELRGRRGIAVNLQEQPSELLRLS